MKKSIKIVFQVFNNNSKNKKECCQTLQQRFKFARPLTAYSQSRAFLSTRHARAAQLSTLKVFTLI